MTTTEHIIDRETIAEARETWDDPEHPDSLSVNEYRNLLDQIQSDAEKELDLWIDQARDEGDMVVETDNAWYIGDASGHAWSETMNLLDIDDPNGVARGVLQAVHHRTAIADGYAARGRSDDECVDIHHEDIHVVAKP